MKDKSDIARGLVFIVGSVACALASTQVKADDNVFLQAGSLISSELYPDASAKTAPIGKIVDFSFKPGEIVDLVVQDKDGTYNIPFGQVQVFLDKQGVLRLVSPAPTDRSPVNVPEGDLLFSKLPDEKKQGATFRQQAFDLTFYGNDAARDVIDTLISYRNLFGSSAFLTAKYQIQSNDTICKIYSTQTALPLNEKRCPASVELLNDAINPGVGLVPGATIEIPQVSINTRANPKANPRQSLGYDGQYSVRLPVNSTMADKFTTEAYSGKFSDKLGGSLTFDYTDTAPLLDNLHSTPQNTAGGNDECPASSEPDQEKSFYYLFDWLAEKNWTPPDEIKACALQCSSLHPGDPSKCGDIVLVDQPLNKNSDLSDAVQLNPDGEPSGISLASSVHSCSPARFKQKTDHGTHLASIIGSRMDGHGFVGLSSGLNLFDYPLTSDTTSSDLSDLIAKRSEMYLDNGPQVFVFASTFPGPRREQGPPMYSYAANARQDNGPHIAASESSELSLNQPRFFPTLQRSLYSSKNYGFWVVSAMQKDPEQKIDAPFEVEETLAFSPVNLGDLPNVLVATACENCKEGEASLWKDAFYGQKFVQIAAPSMSIAAPINESGVALAGGTSQAAAVVGAVAGAMLNCYPEEFKERGGLTALNAGHLKERLQYTSRPIFYEEDDLKKIAAGVVDPEVALLDPGKNWIKATGSETYAEIPKTDDIDHWCQTSLKLIDWRGDMKPIASKNMLRMVRMKNPKFGAGAKAWVVFSDKPDTPGAIDRFDPRTFDDTAKENVPLIAMADGTYLRAKDFDDLILSHAVRSGQCPAH